jgi:transposase
LYFWATNSRLKPVVKVAKMIQVLFANVLSYFDHCITNATSEGLNPKIYLNGEKNPFGFRKRKNLKTAIFFHCGSLALSPRGPKKKG